MNLTLYNIAETYRKALDELSDMDLPVEVVQNTLEGLEGDLSTKATNVAMFTRNLESLAAQIKEAEQAMAHRRKVIENRVENIKDYIKSCMETAGIQKIECPYFALSIKKNPPQVEITGELLWAYIRLPPPPEAEPNKKLIAETIKSGKEVSGARLIQTTRLEIK